MNHEAAFLHCFAAKQRFFERKESYPEVRIRKSAAMQKRTRIMSKGQVTAPRDSMNPGRPPDPSMIHQDSPFAKYRGIGTPGIPSGSKAIVRRIRELRG
jgi:hypothetical protein